MLQDILLLLTGIVVGTMNAIAGGGMLLGFPVLLAVGMPALAANVTSNIIILPGQLSSLFGYRSYAKKIPKQYLILAFPCLLGSIVGALILRHTSSSNFEHIIPGLILFAVLLFAFQPFLHEHLHYHLHGPVEHRRKLRPLILVAFALLPVAIYGGYFGAGFGFIMLAFLGFTNLHEIHQMNALKNMMALVLAVGSLVVLGNTGLIDWHRGLIMGTGVGIGGYLGARLAQRIPSHTIRIIVIAIGLCTAFYLLVRSY